MAEEETEKGELSKPVEASTEAAKPEVQAEQVPEWAKGLVSQVEALSATVASLAPVAGNDSVPTGIPWTHRGGH